MINTKIKKNILLWKRPIVLLPSHNSVKEETIFILPGFKYSSACPRDFSFMPKRRYLLSASLENFSGEEHRLLSSPFVTAKGLVSFFPRLARNLDVTGSDDASKKCKEYSQGKKVKTMYTYRK